MSYERVIDQWAGLNHKGIMHGSPGNVPEQPSWVPREEFRRLNAYRVLAAYRLNASKEFVQASSDDERLARREYGDADLFVRQVAAAVIGRGASLSVIGANRPPEEPPEDASPEQTAEFERVKAAFPQLVTRQADISKWAEDEQWALRINGAEEDAVALGDTVYWLTFSAKKKRARLRVLDPGFYFPVYPADGDADDYPSKVHLAWEYEQPGPATLFKRRAEPERWLRRITYELVPTEPRQVRYSDELVTETCLMTDARWRLNDLKGTAEDLDITTAVITENDEGLPIFELDLGIDFIPVVHLPNMGATGGSPWGTSLLTSIAQVLDDIQIADTDSSEAETIAGGPPIALAGTSKTETTEHYGPRTVWFLPSGGGASVLDTSKGLESLQAHVDRLFKRASTNARVPEEVLGKTGAADVPSGLALALSFGPFEVMVEQARLVRKFKYGLLLKMVQRLHIAQGVWEGAVYPAEVVFGSALPSDFGTLTDILTKLTGNKQLVSRSTALGILSNAGLPIPDVPTEVDRIEGEDYDSANMLYRATRSPALAAELLRLDLPEDVLMEQVGKLIGRDVKLDEVRELFDQKKAAEEAQKVLDAQRASESMGNAREGGTVSRNAPAGGRGTRQP